MVKNIKFLIVFFSLILSIGCSFDNKTGIWNTKEKERISKIERKQKQDKKEIVKLFSSANINLKEIPAIKKINLEEPKKNLSWQMKGLNLQNSIGNIYLPSINKNFLKKKIGKNKFKLSKITSTPLILNNNIFFADDTGSIFSINQKGIAIFCGVNVSNIRLFLLIKSLIFIIILCLLLLKIKHLHLVPILVLQDNLIY